MTIKPKLLAFANPAATQLAAMASDTPDAATGETFTKEFVDNLKAQLEQKNEEAAKLKAFKATHDEKQRAIISQMQPDIQDYVQSLAKANADYASEMQPIVDWGRSCHESASLETAMPMARVLSCASAQWKRTREEASANADRAATLGQTMKELEEVKADRDTKLSRIAELESLCNERQLAAEKMQEELARVGIIKDKYDFSKLSSREANAGSAQSEAVKTEDAASTPSAITASTSLASKRVVQDELMSFVSSNARSMSSNRISQSNTTHAYLGSSGNGLDAEIANALRGAF